MLFFRESYIIENPEFFQNHPILNRKVKNGLNMTKKMMPPLEKIPIFEPRGEPPWKGRRIRVYWGENDRDRVFFNSKSVFPPPPILREDLWNF